MLRLADDYTEAEHDRALQRLADDIDAHTPPPAWSDDLATPLGTVDIDAPLVRTANCDPVDLGTPWTATQKVMVLGVIVAAMVLLWAIGGGA